MRNKDGFSPNFCVFFVRSKITLVSSSECPRGKNITCQSATPFRETWTEPEVELKT